jgi:hypothetical protein
MDVQYPLFFLAEMVRDGAEQIDIYDAIREAEAERQPRAEIGTPDGALFGLRIIDGVDTRNGALFGIGV